MKSAREQADRFQKLAGEKFVSDLVAKQKLDEVTDQEIKLQALRRTRAQVDRDLVGREDGGALDPAALARRRWTRWPASSREIQESLARSRRGARP